ncbi:MAG: nuclear transport factor 2 family protein [Bacteroidota bacterium]
MSKIFKLIFSCFLVISVASKAQVKTSSELYKTLKANDSLLFQVGFNTCELSSWEILLAEDLEFYHDKGGVLRSKKDFITQFKNGICGSPDFKSRRELVTESLKVFPLYDNGILYGAIQQGEHRFFESTKGRPEQPGSTAKFDHLWIKEEGSWKLKRAFSYDHKMQTPDRKSQEISVSQNILQSFTGTYQAPKSGTVIISAKENSLHLKAEGMEAVIYPISKTEFAHKQAPLVFKFVKDDHDKVTRFIVIENGSPVEEAIKK